MKRVRATLALAHGIVTRVSELASNPRFMLKFMGWQVVFWMIMIPVSIFTGWAASTVFVSFLSLYALVLSAGAWYEAVAVRVKQDEEVSS